MIHLRYLRYILRHKWFVFLAACRLGVPWLGLIHDLSKFRPCEWVPYARNFYGDYPDWSTLPPGMKSIYYGPTKQSVREDFDVAWLEHIHANKHHGQHWVLREDEGGVKCLDMPERYRREMLADWIGASLAQGHGSNTRGWYLEHRDKMKMHPDTKAWVEMQLGLTW